MKPGPKPMPRNMRLVSGMRKDRVNEHEPEVQIAIPEPPEDLSDETPAGGGRSAVDWFVHLAGKLARMRVMTEFDVEALSKMAEDEVIYRRAMNVILQSDLIIKAPQSGALMQNPWVAVKNKAQERLMKGYAEFGMTPSSRTRVNKQ